MKVIFNCKHFSFHKDYCENIISELESRGHVAVVSNDESLYPDADFTVQPDEACKRQGGKGVWINHAFPFIPQNNFYLQPKFKHDLKINSDYIFTFSKAWKDNHAMYDLETFVVGMPKLDGLFNIKKDRTTILYSPTWNDDLTSLKNVDQEKLKSYGDFIFRGHPAFHDNEVSYRDAIKKATIVISDYSSVGLESIVLNIPTILFESDGWKSVRTEHVSNIAMKAAICVSTQEDLEKAIQKYISEPDYLEKERLLVSDLLCEHKDNSAKIFVDQLEKLL